MPEEKPDTPVKRKEAKDASHCLSQWSIFIAGVAALLRGDRGIDSEGGEDGNTLQGPPWGYLDLSFFCLSFLRKRLSEVSIRSRL